MNKKILFLLCILLVGTGCYKRKAEVIWNLPPLIGKDIDAVYKALGEPDRKTYIPNISTKIAFEYIYEKSGNFMSINFNPYTRKVNDFTIIYSLGYATQAEMLKTGNLKPTTSKYLARCKADDHHDSLFSMISLRPKRQTKRISVILKKDTIGSNKNQ